MDAVASVIEEAIDGVGEVLGHLPHPSPIRLVGDARDVDEARFELDDEQDIVMDARRSREDFYGEEVAAETA